MPHAQHFAALERAYHDAPSCPPGATLKISEGKAQLSLQVQPAQLHWSGAADPGVLLTLLHDALFYAGQSLVWDVRLLSVTFAAELMDSVALEEVAAIGRVYSVDQSLITAEARLYNAQERQVAHGSAKLSRSNLPLELGGG